MCCYQGCIVLLCDDKSVGMIVWQDIGKYSVDADDRFVVGDSALRVLREGMEIVEPYSNGGNKLRCCLCEQ